MAEAEAEAEVGTQLAAADSLTAQLVAYVARYEVANAGSKAAFEANKAAGVPGGSNRSSIYYDPFPLTFQSGDGATLTTADGAVLTDMQGNYTAGLFGHNPPVVREAVAAAMANGYCLGGNNVYERAVAAEFTARFPSVEMVRFANTGTESATLAINTARAVTGRPKVLMYDGAYHGGTIHGGQASGPADTPYEQINVMPQYDDPAGIVAAIVAHAPELACVILEPVLIHPAAYIKVPAPAAYLRAVADACAAAGCALIFDEVMSSRLAPGGVQQLVGVTPDMTVFGKYFAGGLSRGR